jgi:hypothetical protein
MRMLLHGLLACHALTVGFAQWPAHIKLFEWWDMLSNLIGVVCVMEDHGALLQLPCLSHE